MEGEKEKGRGDIAAVFLDGFWLVVTWGHDELPAQTIH